MTDEVFMSPIAAHQTAQSIANTQDALKVTVASDILDAIGSGLFTSSTDVTSETSADVQYVAGLLNKMNYLAHSDGDNLVVSW